MRARAIRKNSLIACIFHHFATRHKCNKHSREPDVVDGVKYWVKSVRFKVPFKKGTPEEYDTLELNRTFQPNEVHVETVVLLSKGEISTKKLRVEFPLEEMDMSGFQQGATYEEIQEYVLEKHGLKVNSLYIAQIKRKCGLPVGEHYNISKNEDARVPRCTPEKEAAIMDAFRHFNMIR